MRASRRVEPISILTDPADPGPAAVAFQDFEATELGFHDCIAVGVSPELNAALCGPLEVIEAGADWPGVFGDRVALCHSEFGRCSLSISVDRMITPAHVDGLGFATGKMLAADPDTVLRCDVIEAGEFNQGLQIGSALEGNTLPAHFINFGGRLVEPSAQVVNCWFEWSIFDSPGVLLIDHIAIVTE